MTDRWTDAIAIIIPNGFLKKMGITMANPDFVVQLYNRFDGLKRVLS